MTEVISEKTLAQKKRKKRLMFALCFVVVLALGFFGFKAIDAGLKEQGQMSVRNAILNTAKQCCAIEGAYPSSLSYLEENYGLVVNHNDYVITYEVFAENVMPSVVVLVK